MKKKICIISLSQIDRDARVLRQIQYLSRQFDVTVIGFGKPHPDFENKPNVRWITVDNSKTPLLVAFGLLSLGKFRPLAYEKWYWRKRTHVQAFQKALAYKCDGYHANEWNALPLSVEAARLNHSKVVFDAHEYTPGQYESADFLRRWLMPDAILYLFRKYFPALDASIAAVPGIAELYKDEFNIDPMVVFNAPDRINFLSNNNGPNPDQIQMVHHGVAKRDRYLETMVETISLCDKRFHLHFMLVQHDPGYRDDLKRLSGKIAPGRVTFHDPIPPEKIVSEISQYDMGFYLLQPTDLNKKITIPNKLFDFINAGLAVCVGPSPSMAEVVNRYGLGCVAPTFQPYEVAETLNKLEMKDLLRMKEAARKASNQFNAENEMSKVVKLYGRLFGKSE